MAKAEANILKAALLEAGKHPNVVLFRNNVGIAWQGNWSWTPEGHVLIRNPRRVRYGLVEGSSDLIGWQTIEITSDMVGAKVAVFLGAETKRRDGKPTEGQHNFMRQVNNAGGRAGIVRAPEDLRALLSGNVTDQ